MITDTGLVTVYELEGKKYLKLTDTGRGLQNLEPLSQPEFEAMKKETIKNSKDLFGK